MLPSAPTSTLTVRVLLFASYAELLGRDAIELELEAPATVGDVLDHLRSLTRAEALPTRPMCAVNLVQAATDDLLAQGDEVAILPPLSGG
ncbi:MAG TPA: MoaD/ThiS family protein [Gemmatimonadales bacterium]|nr:MoaD/ThiS family protein [Gemmatimonadales bacterium]